MATVAYSYQRFSSPEQAKGDSIRRQEALRDGWLKNNPAVKLDLSLELADKGKGAYNREDFHSYALAEFIRCIESHRVAAGSYLLIENLDRLSREDEGTATELFLSIVNRGVVVVQLSPAVKEFRKPVRIRELLDAIFELSRGHSESQMKSTRVGEAWREKKRNAATTVLTRMTPGWIKYDDDKGKLVLDETKAATVRRIYRLAREGFGLGAICQRLNTEKVPLLGRTTFKGQPLKWSANVVYKVLSNRAVIGEYQPHVGRKKKRKPVGDVVKDYYPAVIKEDEFNAVRGIMSAKNSTRRGRRGKHVNLFAGLLRDARTGGSLTAKHGHSRSGVLIPVESRVNLESPWISFPLIPFEQAIRERLAEVQVKDVVGTNGVHDRIDALQGQIADQETLQATWVKKMDNPKIADVVATKLGEIGDRLKQLRAEVAEAQQEAASPISEAWATARAAAKTLTDDDSDDAREKYRGAVRRAVESIYVLMMPGRGVRVAAVQVWFKNGAHRDYLIACKVAQGTGKAKGRRDPQTRQESFADDTSGLDFRNPDDTAALIRKLEAYDPEELFRRLDKAKAKG